MGVIMNTLELKNVTKNFYTELGELKVLDGVTFDVKEGEIVAIVGPSGSGKSTILNVIAGLLKPTSGEVLVNGEMGYMFQKDQLFEWRTIWKNVLLGLEIKKQRSKEFEDNVREMLEKYELIDFVKNYPSELSGGMRQRIALIRTLATKPTILLLDEPFSALDFQTRLIVSDDVYRIIKAEHLSAILVSHDISEAISIADRVIVLSKRPAMLKNIHPIEIDKELYPTPIARRTAPEFRKYFDEIWCELNE